MKKFGLVIIFFILVFMSFILIELKKQTYPVIVIGSANPGKIFIYKWDGGFHRTEIDTGYKLVHTVRIGNIFNNGRKMIVAGVGNSFYGPPFGCSVIAYDFSDISKSFLIDEVGDLRCKDITIGDADNDGKNEIVLGTHGEGIIKVYDFEKNGWKKTEIDRNFIQKIDLRYGTNHRIPRDKITYETIVQTAVHIVKIGDADNDGKNEIVVTVSSPLEYNSGPQISFVNVYSYSGGGWISKTIHSGTGFQHRSILIDDVDYDGKNEILIGAAPSRLFMFKYDGKNWNANFVYNESIDKNMKGLDFADVNNEGIKRVILSTGVPYSLTYFLKLDKAGTSSERIGNISEVMKRYDVIQNLRYNSLEVKTADLDFDGKQEIVVAGEADTSADLSKLIPEKDVFGWEATPFGFVVVYKKNVSVWTPYILDKYSVLGMDIQ